MTAEPRASDPRVSVDNSSDIIRVVGSGFWRPEEIEAVLDQLAALVARAHADGRGARVLVDMTESGAQLGDTVQRIRRRSAAIYKAGDRLAVVLGSALLKRQVTRVERAADTAIFDDIAAADNWLRTGMSPPA